MAGEFGYFVDFVEVENGEFEQVLCIHRKIEDNPRENCVVIRFPDLWRLAEGVNEKFQHDLLILAMTAYENLGMGDLAVVSESMRVHRTFDIARTIENAIDEVVKAKTPDPVKGEVIGEAKLKVGDLEITHEVMA